MSFKLLAIRPLEGCNSKFLKNLIPNQIYKFYSDYEFILNDEGIVNNIEYVPNVPEDFYYQGDENYKTKINVSAIVGRNGSGKSALVELLTAAIFKISLSVDNDFVNSKNLYNSSDKKLQSEFIKNFENSLKEDLNNLKIEIYYLHKGNSLYRALNLKTKIRKIKLINNEISILDFEEKLNNPNFFDNNSQNYFDIKQWKTKFILGRGYDGLSDQEIIFFKDFFYTMIINYSHYGYNTKESGEWLKGIFHKNDSYQLPIVINPFREEGNININSEKHLASNRFLVNILQEEKLRNISENKIVTHLSIEIDKSKFSSWDANQSKDLRIANSEIEKKEILELLLSIFFQEKNYKITNEEYFIFPYLRDYILLKLYKITYYKKYQKFRNEKFIIMKVFEKEDSFLLLNTNNLRLFIEELQMDFSHITDKLRQSLFYLKFPYLTKDDLFNFETSRNLIEIDKIFNKIELAHLKNNEKIPIKEKFLIGKFTVRESLPGIFKTNFYFDSQYSENNFNNFSSGEKQKIYSIHSVIYHLRNLKSVDESINGVKMIYYKNINIIFDEIELYAHPAFQRKFLNDLLFAINCVNQRYDNLNIMFITHSPFILSDIPKQNVLFLEVNKNNQSEPQNFERMNTFGANITDLLADSFFINDGLIGNFAKKKIEEIISWLNCVITMKEKVNNLEQKNIDHSNDAKIVSQQNKIKNFLKSELSANSKDFENHFKIIQIIDEPVLKNKLEEMYLEATSEFPKKEILRKQIAKMQKQLEELQKLN